MNAFRFLVIYGCFSWFWLLQPEQPKLKIFMAGDSTMQLYDTSRTPQRGWGQVFGDYFNNNVQIVDLARGGRSTKSYIKEGLWNNLVNKVHKGDWVIIEFGHNDHDKRKPERFTTPVQYKNNLITMIRDVQGRGANPIVLTPIAMRNFDKSGVYKDGHGSYPCQARLAAQDCKIPVIDVDSLFGHVITQLGPEKSKDLFMNFGPGLYKAYPDGKTDNTHLRLSGAKVVAGIVADQIKTLKISPISKYIL